MKSRGSGNGARTEDKGESLVGGISDFAENVATLLELQAQLAMLDLKECIARATLPLIFVAIGLALMLASLPVILGGLALVLATALNIGIGAALLLTGLVVLVVSGLIAYTAWLRSRPGFDSFRRSREELVRNLSWIRTVVVHSGRSPKERRF
jgi:uncharacterized membrane protein YqjE